MPGIMNVDSISAYHQMFGIRIHTAPRLNGS